MQIGDLYKLFRSSTGVSTDTRHILLGSIFFALKGEKFDANEFAAQSLLQGAAYAVVDRLADTKWETQFGAQIILVENALRTLQQLAKYHRQQFKCPVLAITGSNGKTTTKELIAEVLSAKYKTYATKGNLNNHIGIPLTLLSIKDDAEFVVIEMGANHQGEIASYCEYVIPDFGLITNVGMAHTEGFGGFEGVVKGKTELYRNLAERKGKVFVCAENKILNDKAAEFGFWETDITRYGQSSTAFCCGSVVTGNEFLTVETESSCIQTLLVGDYNFENVMSAVCVGKYFGVDFKAIKSAIESYVPSNNRSQKIKVDNNIIILDAYNANPSSMKVAIENFSKIHAQKKVLILGEMMELGEYAAEEHQHIKKMTDEIDTTLRVFVGNGFSFLTGAKDVLYFSGTDELLRWFQEQHFENCTILIKGSRKNQLERLISETH